MNSVAVSLARYLVLLAFGALVSACGANSETPTVKNITQSFELTPSTTAQEFGAQGVAVGIPAGTLTSAAKLSITKLGNPPPPNFKGLESGGAYEIQLGDLHQFDAELTLGMAYDPAKLRTDIPIERVISAAYWDPTRKVWMDIPVQLDLMKHEVVIKTHHLSVFSWFMKKVGYDVFFKNNFYVTYNKAEVTDPNFLMYYHNPDSSNYADLSVPRYVQDVTGFLIDAWKVYVDDLGFKPPSAPVDVYVGTDLSSFSEKFTGIVLISLLPKTPEMLKLTTAHELFHRVQNSYYNDLGGMALLTWWLEATADYAGDYVAWKGLNLMGGEGGIKRNYLDVPLTDSSDTHNEGYATAYFVKFLVDGGANFKAMWEAAAAGNALTLLSGLDTYLQSVHGAFAGLPTQYRNFARFFLFDTKSPMPPVADSLYTEVASVRTSMSGNPEQTATLNVPAGYTTRMWGLWFDSSLFQGAKTKRLYTVSLSGAVPAGVLLDVFLLKGDKRLAGGATPVGTISGKTLSTSVEVLQGDAVYVLAINSGSGAQTLNLRISEVTCVPDPKATTCPADSCGEANNNCGQIIDCGSCAMGPCGAKYFHTPTSSDPCATNADCAGETVCTAGTCSGRYSHDCECVRQDGYDGACGAGLRGFVNVTGSGCAQAGCTQKQGYIYCCP